MRPESKRVEGGGEDWCAECTGGYCTWHCDVGAVVEVGGEQLRVDCCRHENDFQVLPFAQQPPQQNQQEITIQAPLVHLVDDDVRDARQCRVGLCVRFN